jgi:hypothetical protein
MITASKLALYVALIQDECWAYLFSQTRLLEFFGLARTSVGYCHVDEGCKIAMDGLPGSNGIARAQNGTIYVANSKFGQIHVLEEQNDHSLVLSDIIVLGACGNWR